MVTSSSRFAYGDCFELMDKAVADTKGIQIKFARHEDAWHFRIRLHTARRIDRVENREIYNEGDPMYGKSIYDQLTMRIRNDNNGSAWLRMERIDAQEFEIQSLSDIVPEEPEPQKMVIENVPVEVIPIRRFVRRF